MAKASTGQGGKRANSGPKAKDAPYNPTTAEYDALLTDLSEEEFLLVKESLWALANGTPIMAWAPKKDIPPDDVLLYADQLCAKCRDKCRAVRVYRDKPDIRALKTILEHQVGKPGQKQQERLAPVIVLKHEIPGISDLEYKVGIPRAPTVQDIADLIAPLPGTYAPLREMEEEDDPGSAWDPGAGVPAPGAAGEALLPASGPDPVSPVE